MARPTIFDRWEPGAGYARSTYAGVGFTLPSSGGDGGGFTSVFDNLDPSMLDDYLALIKSGEAGGSDTGSPYATQSETQAALKTLLAAGVKAIAPHPLTGQCPAGYQLSGGACVPSGGSQWFPFATNAQVLTFAAVVFGGLVLIKLLPSGGGGGRRR